MTKLFDIGFDLFHLKTPYYLPGSPVLVRTGMLQLDRLTSKVTMILELENISTQPLLSCTVQLTLYDAKNSPYEQVLTYSYEENQIKRGETFGKKNMISLPDDGVRSFSVMATHVVFPDDSEWTNTALFLPVTPRKTLKEEYQDSSLAEEFRIRYGRDCRYKPELFSDLWYCTCGAVNRQSDGNCYSCKRKLKALSSITKESLLQDSDVKIHAGKIKTDEYENLQEQGTYADDVTEELQENPQNDFEINTEPEKSAENQSGELPEQEHTDENTEPVARKKILPAMQKRKLLSVSCFCFAAVILLFVCYITVVRPGKELQKQYEAAEQLLADGAFSEAEEAFVSLGDYSDAREKAEEVPYKKALYILQCAENGNPAALRLFPEKKQRYGYRGIEVLSA